MKGDLTKKFLEIVENGVLTVNDVFSALTAPYASSPSERRRRLESNRRQLEVAIAEFKKSVKDTAAFSDLLYRLKRDGLIITENKNSIPKLTNKGRLKISSLKPNVGRQLPSPQYIKEGGDELKIVIFDIPENIRFKRNWLRSVLHNLEFKMLQKSVWIGKSKIPQVLIEDLRKFNLLDYVEIFIINKTGSLRSLKF